MRYFDDILNKLNFTILLFLITVLSFSWILILCIGYVLHDFI